MNDTYKIARSTIEKVLEVLSDHWFSDDGEYNNDDVIEVEKEISEEIKFQ